MPTSINSRNTMSPAATADRRVGDWRVFVIALIAIVLFIVAGATLLPIDPGPFQPMELIGP